MEQLSHYLRPRWLVSKHPPLYVTFVLPVVITLNTADLLEIAHIKTMCGEN